MASLSPPLVGKRKLAVTSIYSAANLLSEEMPVVTEAPFRQPHHTSTKAALLGGGSVPQPGEISLAHHGILFMDELPLFPASTLEALREPLTSGQISINRLGARVTYPADFQLVGAYNPCRCGYLGSKKHRCRCSLQDIIRYQRSLSGPILDRISLFVRMGEVKKLINRGTGEHHRAFNQVVAAKRRQFMRGQKVANARLSGQFVVQLLRRAGLINYLEDKMVDQGLSMRRMYNAVRVAQTIADLAELDLNVSHLEEALALLPPSELENS